MYYDEFESQFGKIQLQADDEGLTALAFQGGDAPISSHGLTKNPEKFIEVKKQLIEYFDGKRKAFSLVLSMKGTAFQKDVWQELQKIPFGKSCSYGDIASKLNNPKAVRAVGAANGKNPIAVIVPCHRVIGANKKLTGYAGGLPLKQKLLTLEGIEFS